MSKKHAVLWFGALAALLVAGGGCSLLGGGGGTGLPGIGDFPAEELTFRLPGPVDASRAALLRTLSENDVRFREEASDPAVYVLTTFVTDPVEKGAKRMRRAAYRVRLAADEENPDGSVASVTWVVQSKGLREELWGSLPDDAYYRPTSLTLIKELFIPQPGE